MEIHPRLLFNEPRGQRTGLTFVSLSFVCFLGYAYFGILLNGPYHLLIMGVAFVLTGFAELLPPNRRRLAGLLRVLAVGILVGMVVLLVFAPEQVVG